MLQFFFFFSSVNDRFQGIWAKPLKTKVYQISKCKLVKCLWLGNVFGARALNNLIRTCVVFQYVSIVPILRYQLHIFRGSRDKRYSLGPGYLKDRFTLQICEWPLISSWEDLFHFPPPTETKLVGTRERAFSVVLTLLLGAPPDSRTDLIFCRTLKTELVSWTFYLRVFKGLPCFILLCF